MTDNDLELIELASSTSYRDTIYKYIEEADTDECRDILRSILENPDIIWEQ